MATCLRFSFSVRHLTLGAALLTFGALAAGETQAQSLDDTGVLGINSVQINKDVVVNADVVGNDASSGPTLDGGVELSLGNGATVNGKAIADSIILNKNASATAFLCNDIEDKNNPASASCAAVILPVFDPLTVFQQFGGGGGQSGADVNVPSGGSATLGAGSHGDVTIGSNATLILTGGIYNIRSLSTGQGSSVLFRGPSDIRLEGNLAIAKDSFVGDDTTDPADPLNDIVIQASQIIFYVGGSNVLGATPNAANIGQNTDFFGNVYGPNGTLNLDKGIIATGAFFGQDVNVNQPSTGPSGRVTTINVDSFFANKPPVANPQDVFTNGIAPIVITLNGSDPEADDLSFSIVGGPLPLALTNGTLSNLSQDPIPSPGVPPGCTPDNGNGVADPGECTTDPDPPRTSATVTYTPNGLDNLADSFQLCRYFCGYDVSLNSIALSRNHLVYSLFFFKAVTEAKDTLPN